MLHVFKGSLNDDKSATSLSFRKKEIDTKNQINRVRRLWLYRNILLGNMQWLSQQSNETDFFFSFYWWQLWLKSMMISWDWFLRILHYITVIILLMATLTEKSPDKFQFISAHSHHQTSTFRRLYLWKQQYICQFNLNYPIKKTYNAPFWYHFHSTVSKKHSCPSREFLPKTQQYLNNKITSKNYRFSRHYILWIYNPNLVELIFKPVLMYLNVFCNWCYL